MNNVDWTTVAYKNGEETVLLLLQEECAELIQAISKYRRYANTIAWEAVIEELADVEIMLYQIKTLWKCATDDIAEINAEKLKRTIERCY